MLHVDMKVWEVKPDGTMELVTYLGRSLWPGAHRIVREDGTHAVSSRLVDRDGEKIR